MTHQANEQWPTARRIRTSAKAVIIRDGKLALIRISDGRESWYILPGGGQDAEESLPEAVCREVAEEMGLDIACRELLFVIEGIRGEDFHRVDLVFRCELRGELPDGMRQVDSGQVGVDWVDIATLNTSPLYPSKLRRPIMQAYQNEAHPIYLGNEEIGDPAVSD